MAESSPIFHALSPAEAGDPRWQLVQRVAASVHLKGSSRLRDFLLYVTECAIRESPQEATEQQIGMFVFQRPAGYNSSEDSIVRTHARLLRQKLAAYFANEGAAEELVIEIPKGQYLPVFRPAVAVAPAPVALPAEQPAAEIPVAALAKHRPLVTTALLALLVPVAMLVWWMWPKAAPQPSDLERLWHPFLTGEPPFVIYSNALFVGDSKTGLRVSPPESGEPAPEGSRFVESYTGIGEVVAVHEITQLFDAHHASFVLKRSRLVSWDEAKSKNLVFIGAPSQNPALKVVPSTTNFVIVHAADSTVIANLHPKAGEPATFERPEHPLTKDYAIVALLPGAQRGKWMIVLSGLTTLGTQAAAEFFCRPEEAAQLVQAASGPDKTVQPFEGVVEITIHSGVPIQTRLVALHVR